MKIQPSLERVKVSGLPVFEMEAASSSSETRLFCFFSPEKRTFASVTRANPQSNIDNKIGAIGVIFIEGRRERVLHEFSRIHFKLSQKKEDILQEITEGTER